jgi:hypothetical protein
MIKAIVEQRRGWMIWRRRYTLNIPQRWSELSKDDRRKWWRWAAILPPEKVRQKLITHLLPWRLRAQLTDLDANAILSQLEWVSVKPSCDEVAVESFHFEGIEYVFPSAKGGNITAIEYALADEFYQQGVAGDENGYLMLTACLWREALKSDKKALKRGDRRSRLFSREEVEARAETLKRAPTEMHIQAIAWWVGFKTLMREMYKTWLFSDPDEEEDEEGIEKAAKPSGPDFGWWGIYLDIAETGIFGDIKQVHQTPIHDICIYMVKRKAAEMAANITSSRPRTTEQPEE